MYFLTLQKLHHLELKKNIQPFHLEHNVPNPNRLK
jgi:hypothetical protein